MNDNTIPSPRSESWKPIFLIISLIPPSIHLRLELCASLLSLFGSLLLANTGVDVVNIMSFTCRQLPVLPQDHDPGHIGIIILRPWEIEPHSVPLPKIVNVMSITFAQLKNDTLRLACQVRGGVPPKMQSAETPEFVVFVFPLRGRVYDAYTQCNASLKGGRGNC